MLRRRALIAAMPVAAAAQFVSADVLGGATNEIVVGPGCDFEQLAPALASITDNSKDNPYLIRVLPGIYNLRWAAKSWVTVMGSGPMATIFEGVAWNRITIFESNVYLSNFGIRYTGSVAGHAAVSRSGLATSVVLDNIHIDHSGAGAAMRNSGGSNLLTWWLKGLQIRTEGVGLYLGGHTYCDDLKVILYGDNSGHAHVGCLVEGNSARIYLNNCRIGTGYWFGYDNGAYIRNEVRGPDDVIGVWVPEGSIVPRVEIHGLESFCRNEDNSSPVVNVNILRVEGGWVRAFGCFGQTETPADWPSGKSLYQSGDGKIEQFSSRFTREEGRTFGSENLGVQTFTNADDGFNFTKFEGGLHRLDSSAGSFALVLPPAGYVATGVQHIFKKISADDNNILIDLAGGWLEGQSSPVFLQSQYETLKVAWDGVEWIRT